MVAIKRPMVLRCGRFTPSTEVLTVQSMATAFAVMLLLFLPPASDTVHPPSATTASGGGAAASRKPASFEEPKLWLWNI